MINAHHFDRLGTAFIHGMKVGDAVDAPAAVTDEMPPPAAAAPEAAPPARGLRLAERLAHIPHYAKPILITGGATALGVGAGYGAGALALAGLERHPAAAQWVASVPHDVLARRLRTIGGAVGATAGLVGSARSILSSRYIHDKASQSFDAARTPLPLAGEQPVAIVPTQTPDGGGTP